MENFFDKEYYTIEDIEDLIQAKAEESINLEFKRHEAIQNNKEVAKDISSFANSAGGIIIYGIEEVDHVASNISYIDGSVYTKERLEQVINSSIHPRLQFVKIIPVRNQNKIEETIYIVKIQEGTIGPHMTRSKYYKRFNFQSVVMEEYEVRASYFKTRKSTLEILSPIIHRPREGFVKHVSNKKGHFIFILRIKNIGTVIEKDYKLEFFIDEGLYLGYYRKKLDTEKYKVKQFEGILNDHFIIPNKHPIFPKETVEVIALYINIDQVNYKEALKKTIHLNLYYSSGLVSKKFTIEEIFDLHEERIESQTLGYTDTKF